MSLDHLIRSMRGSGVSQSQRVAVIDNLRAVATSENAPKIRLSTVCASLTQVAIPEQHRVAVARKLAESGLFDNDISAALDAMSAASEDRPRVALRKPIEAANDPIAAPLLKQLRATARRLGFDWRDDEPIDTFKLDQALASQDLDTRFRLKSALAQLKLIP